MNVDSGTILTADVPSQQARNYDTGQKVVLSFPPDACQVLPLDTRDVELERLAEAEEV
ncbi:MAG TPA: TOBE domain-containing protein [Ktedonobacteraceae bacterium]|nr:TOBE domain-containing protein [Ktedonobacteraceae bacterium]